jgi:hypothetical protein
LIEAVTAYFGLESISREIELLSALSQQQALEWLDERGIALTELSAPTLPAAALVQTA